MSVLLLSGQGPEFKNRAYLDGSLFDPRWDGIRGANRPLAGLSLASLRYQDSAGAWRPLMRTKTGGIPCLVTYVLESILYGLEEDYESFHLDHVWTGDAEPSTANPEVVLLSTTFICNRPTLARAITWIEDRYADVPLILGGQYSNLKYATILRDHPQVSFVVRGDGETALPALLHALRTGGRPEQVPNLVWRDWTTGKLRINPMDYIDLDIYPAPAFPGSQAVLPYESMRGCPFSCRFCSYPAASPQWRHKSADKILADWMGYAAHNNVRHIQAMDSTFTVPKPRLLQLLPRLSTAPFTWEAYTRANAIHSAELVAALEAAHCHKLSIGFESMSPTTLAYMRKQVRAEHNRRAHDLLAASDIRYRVSYMVGYPGETAGDFALTARYLREEYTGHFMLSVFSFLDETMPVWQDAERFGLTVATPDDPDYSWSHNGMDVAEAQALHRHTLDATRWGNDRAVLLLWQADYLTPLIPGASRHTALRLEKAIERLAMLPVDYVNQPDEQIRRAYKLLITLARDGVQPCDGQGRPIDVLELLTQTTGEAVPS